jgi:LuxR family maltose regulon positive regulatory protein
VKKPPLDNYTAVTPAAHPYLLRSRLCDLLEQAAQCPLVTVVAGAGYGKTQAVYSFLKGYDGDKAWLQLSGLDNMGVQFWEKFIRAAAANNRGLAARLMSIGFPASDRQFEQCLAVLLQEMPANRKLLLVFDDFHLISDKLVLQFVEKLSFLNSPHLSVLLISRTEPDINIIGLLAKGMVFQINETELRFTKEEMLCYLNMLGITLNSQAATRAYAATGGWIFAIHLLSQVLKNGTAQGNRALLAMRANIFKLIENEIFRGFSEALQHFLIRLSLIEHWSPSLLSELAQNEGLLDELRKTSSFIRYDTYADVYRIHHLFFEYLQQKQDSLSQQDKQVTYRKAAQWCGQNGYMLDAVIYYEKIQDYGGIAEAAFALVRMTSSRVAEFLLQVLNRIPEEAYRENVELYIIKNKMLQTLTQFDAARLQAQEVIRTFEALPATPLNNWLLSECYFNLGYIGIYTALHTNVCDFSDLFERGYHYYLCSGKAKGRKERAIVSAYVSRTGYPAAKGDLQRGNEIFSRYSFYAIRAKDGLMRGMAELANCEVAYFMADLNAAEKWAYQALQYAREAQQFQIENRALFFLLRISIHRGGAVKARSVLQQLNAQLEQEEFLSVYTLNDIVTGWFFAQIRQTDRIAGWLKNSFEKSDLNPLLFGLENLVRAKSYFVAKKYHEALAALDGQDGQYGLEAFLLGKLELTVFRAACTYHMGDKGKAIGLLREAYGIAAADALDMPFIELGKDMRTLTIAAMKEKNCGIPRSWLERIHKKSSTYAKNLSHLISEYRVFHHLNDQAFTLTSREKDILADMCHGLSRTEIACNRNISSSTVKTLIQSIYTKLGTQNTAETIWLAANLKLIG